jgi:hypothetical protein
MPETTKPSATGVDTRKNAKGGKENRENTTRILTFYDENPHDGEKCRHTMCHNMTLGYVGS